MATLAHRHVEPPLRREALLARLWPYLRTDFIRTALDPLATLPPHLEAGHVAELLGCGIEAARSVPTALYA